jgi:hypothetical protein
MKDDDPKDDDPNFTTPPEDFEIVDLDPTSDLPEDQQSWPVADLIQKEDFAIEEILPMLVLTPTQRREAGASNGVPAGDQLAAFVEAVSVYEQSLGGEGLHVFDPVPPVGPNCVALVPWKADGARDRLEQVARWATGMGALATAANVA